MESFWTEATRVSWGVHARTHVRELLELLARLVNELKTTLRPYMLVRKRVTLAIKYLLPPPLR